MDNVFWKDMIRTGVNAYSAREHFGEQDAFDGAGPIWCYDRFGSSLTQLTDGRFVQIGGEHEDFYDPDFHIYNDVVIHDGKGDFQILGYPEDLFPSTDFHSATLVGENIYIIGCLGYPEQRRVGFTPVFQLTVDTWKITAVETGGEMPGWIHRHTAVYDQPKNVIRVTGGEEHFLNNEGQPDLRPNAATYVLDLSSFQWRETT